MMHPYTQLQGSGLSAHRPLLHALRLSDVPRRSPLDQSSNHSEF